MCVFGDYSPDWRTLLPKKYFQGEKEMKCPNCNVEVAETTKFCPECGTKLSEFVEKKTLNVEISEENVTDEIPNTPSTVEINEKKEAKKKKIKKIIIISVSALLACGIIFLILYLVDPFCMFWHECVQINRVEATCGAEGYEEYGCSKCDYVYRLPLSNYNLKHNWDTIPCGKENHCTTCGKTEILNHSYDSLDPICIYCGQELYTIKLPNIPKTINSFDYRDEKESSVLIQDYEISMYTPSISRTVYICFDVKKTYDSKGNGHSSYAKIGWKLYDSKGKVVDSGTDSSEGQLCVGEISEIWISFDYLDFWGEYRLELLDIQ